MFTHTVAGVRYWCHDSKKDIKEGMGRPPAYYMRGVESWYLEDKPELFKHVEWPGIDRKFKIRVPLMAGRWLDDCYPLWHSKVHKFNVRTPGKPPNGRVVSYHRGGAKCQCEVAVNSIAELEDESILLQHGESQKQYWKYVKSLDGRG